MISRLLRPFARLFPAPSRARVEIVRTAGDTIPFDVEVADTVFRRGHGLMGRTEIPERGGMLFVYPWPRIVLIWLARTPVSLDVIFADADGRIVKIAHQLQALSRHCVSSEKPVRLVLEIAAGEAARLGISAGDRVARA